jgi:hypothetical protein
VARTLKTSRYSWMPRVRSSFGYVPRSGESLTPEYSCQSPTKGLWQVLATGGMMGAHTETDSEQATSHVGTRRAGPRGHRVFDN